MNINHESHAISRRSFLKAVGASSAAVAAAGVLSACGGSSSTASSAASTAASAAPATTELADQQVQAKIIEQGIPADGKSARELLLAKMNIKREAQRVEGKF